MKLFFFKVDGVILHLPYILITATMLLFAIEKVFLAMRKGNVVQNKFFALLIDYEILRSSESKAGNEVLVVGDELEQSRDLIDLKDRLEDSSSFFRSYLIVQVPACLPKIYQSANVSEIHFSYFPTFLLLHFRLLKLSSVLHALDSWAGSLPATLSASLIQICIATFTGECTNAPATLLRSTRSSSSSPAGCSSSTD